MRRIGQFFLSEVYPPMRESTRRTGATIRFVDESEIRLGYHAGITLSPRGKMLVVMTCRAAVVGEDAFRGQSALEISFHPERWNGHRLRCTAHHVTIRPRRLCRENVVAIPARSAINTSHRSPITYAPLRADGFARGSIFKMFFEHLVIGAIRPAYVIVDEHPAHRAMSERQGS